MAIINTPKSFDKAQIDAATLGKIEEFVDYVNQQFDQLTRALQSQLTFTENFRSKIVTVSAYNNRQISLNEKSSYIIPLSVSGDSVKQYLASVSNAGIQNLTFKFGEPIPVKTRSVTVSAPFATYEFSGVATLEVGDRIIVRNQSNAANNGTFVVSELTASTIKVYNSNAVAATLTSYVGDEESAKSVTLLLFN